MFRVVALHIGNKCNYNCSFCYRPHGNKTIDKDILLGLPKYLKKITKQVAVGGGEPLIYADLLKEFAKECVKHGIIVTITTNGHFVRYVDKSVFDNIRMVSISYNYELIRTKVQQNVFVENVKYLKGIGKEVGANLLITNHFNNPIFFIQVVKNLFKTGVDRVYALCPKNIEPADIVKLKPVYAYLSSRYKHFYVDDLTNMVLRYGWSGWKKNCHYGQDIVSIDEYGFVYGCSFDGKDKSVLKITQPKDILKLKKLKFKKRFMCPYLRPPR